MTSDCWCGPVARPRRVRWFGNINRLITFWAMDRRELLGLRHKAANPGGEPRRPERWRGPRTWWLYPPPR